MIASPCIGVCELDGASGGCRGCARTADEIAGWRDQTDAWRQGVWAALPQRYARLGLSVTRLPWDQAAIRDHVAANLDRGRWRLGCHGAAVAVEPDRPPTVEDETVTARLPGGALRLRISPALRALALWRDPAAQDLAAVLLTVTRARAALPVADGLTALGADTRAIDDSARGDLWFDLGVGRADMRICIRPEAGLRTALEAEAGAPYPAVLDRYGARLQDAVTVVETAIGRCEVRGPPPLSPAQLATGRATAPGLELPEVYALGAIFEPRRSEDSARH